MKGTEKQIAWAEEIKMSAYNTLDRMEADNEAIAGKIAEPWKTFEDSASPEAIKAVRAELDKFFGRCGDAAVIINNREMFARDYLIKHCRDWMRTH